MKKKHLFKKTVVVGIIVIFLFTSFASSGYSEETDQIDADVADVFVLQENVLVTCRTFGFPGEPSKEISMSLNDAEFLYDKIKDLQIENARDPLSDKTKQLQHEIITLADDYDLLPAGLSAETLKSRLIQSSRPQYPRITLPRLQNRASELFCNYVSTGSGSSFPIIILPRLIPILLSPIPRLFVRWSTMDGITSCGGLRSGTGFIAYGAQNGMALGFWGIGFSIFLPPVMAYGLLGYALFASVNAQEIELWPPNYPPETTAVSPLDGSENVPVSTSELRFQISDFNGDLMSYSVTTTPDIGSVSGNNKPDGAYSVPINGLEGSEEYTWHVQVSDGEDVVDESFTFSTEQVAPIVSNPSPEDGERYVPIELSQLSFKLKDLQGDLMDYTVETVPDIGTGSGTGVGDGTYTVDVSDLDYSTEYAWYVNATDGTYWKHKVFNFQAEHKMIFNPFDEGWQYRKNITIDHTKVAGDLLNFPVLISTIDSDLRDKAQDDGDDILFMDGIGVAARLYHEIEQFDGSSGELVAWVNVTNLTSNQDTTLYMYYGNPSCCSQQAPELVWDSNYVLVQHFDETSGTHYDSTFYDNDGTSHGGVTQNVVGKIDGADNFDGKDDYVDIRNSESLNPENAITLEAWYKTESYSGAGNDPIIDKGYIEHQPPYYQYHLGVTGDNYPHGSYARFASSITVEGSGYGVHTENGFWSTGNWYHLVTTYDGSILKLYVDKLLIDSKNTSGIMTDYGKNLHVSKQSNLNYYLPGTIDEIRISNIARSTAWISTEYSNQNDPSSFLSFGPEETGP